VFVELLPDARLGQSDVALYTLMLASGIFPLLHLLSQ